MLQPQNPWETGELSGLMSVPKDKGEIVNTWTVGVGFECRRLAPILEGKVEPQRYHATINQLNHITRKENTYNYVFTLLLLIFVVLPISYYFFFADITRTQNKEVIILHHKTLMVLTYVVLACDVPALLYIAYLGYRNERNELHSLVHFLLIILAFGNTIAYPFALEFIHAEEFSRLFLLYPFLFPFFALISIFINRRLPELLGEAEDFIEKENQEYYLGQGLRLRLRPMPGDVLYLVVNLLPQNYNSTDQSTSQTDFEELPEYLQKPVGNTGSRQQV
jgi:hypothetical protein